MNKPALFLDRDGVINVNYGYVHSPENFEFIDGIFEVVIAANRAGYLVIVVTNQAGIGRGYYTMAKFSALTDWMKGRFAKHGAQIDAVYFCPHHPEHGVSEYRCDCDCRKPAPGMIKKAAVEHGIDLKNSFLIGDSVSDVQAANSAGITKAILLGEYFKSDLGFQYAIVPNLFSALKYFSEGVKQTEWQIK